MKITISTLAQTADDIQALFYEVKERIASIQNQVTRSKIKNGYPKTKPSIQGSKKTECDN